MPFHRWYQAQRVPVPEGVAPPPAPLLPKYGISTGSIITSWSQSVLDSAITDMQALANGRPFAVRFDVSALNATAVRNIDTVLAAGLTPYVVLYGTSGPTAITTLPTQVATAYAGEDIIFTGPNEPDLHGWGHDQLANFQVGVYNQVKAVDPNMLVGFGALWKGAGKTDLTGFINSFVALAPTKADFISFHGYDDPTVHFDWVIWDWWFPGGFYPSAQTMKTILANGGVNVPIISDECGGNISGGEAGQASRVSSLLQQVGGRVPSLWIFSLFPDNDPNWYIWNATSTNPPNLWPYVPTTPRQAYTTMDAYIAAHP